MAALEPRVEPRVYEHDGFVVTLWTYYEAVTSREVSPADYADALERLHAGMRKVEVSDAALHGSSGRGSAACGERDLTPKLASADRELLINTLRSRRRAIGDRGAAEQLLHGEPHPGNVLNTKTGLLFIDLETCCRGPSSSTSPMSPKRSASAIRTLIKNCSVSAGSSFLPWSPRGAGIRGISSRTGNEQLVSSSALYARVHRGLRSTS